MNELRTCQECVHKTAQGKCDLVNIDCYEFRHISPSDGGCGLAAMKFESRYPVEQDSGEYQIQWAELSRTS